MVDKEFLEGVLNKEDATLEDKVQLIISEHEAETRGLLDKRDQLLKKEVELKAKVEDLTKAKTETDKRLEELVAEAKNNSPEDMKKVLEAQFASKEAEWQTEKESLISERDKFKQSHYQRLRDDAITEGVKDLNFVDGLKDGYVARVLSLHEFETQDVDGKTLFVDKNDKKSIQDVLRNFAMTNEGKAYIKNPTSGGGADNKVNVAVTAEKPQTSGNFNITEAMKAARENPSAMAELKAKLGA